MPFASLRRVSVAFDLARPDSHERVREADLAALQILPVLLAQGCHPR